MIAFPSQDWVYAVKEKLNSDKQYAEIAKKWEGDLVFQIEPGGSLDKPITIYLDLWHGTCRDAYFVNEHKDVQAALILSGPYENYVKLLKGEMDPLQALLTRKLNIKGNMATVMRNVPTVLDFVRCCREVTSQVL